MTYAGNVLQPTYFGLSSITSRTLALKMRHVQNPIFEHILSIKAFQQTKVWMNILIRYLSQSSLDFSSQKGAATKFRDVTYFHPFMYRSRLFWMLMTAHSKCESSPLCTNPSSSTHGNEGLSKRPEDGRHLSLLMNILPCQFETLCTIAANAIWRELPTTGGEEHRARAALLHARRQHCRRSRWVLRGAGAGWAPVSNGAGKYAARVSNTAK